MQIILIVLLCYLLFRFVTGFVLPVATTASRIKKQFNEMNRQQAAFQQHSSSEYNEAEESPYQNSNPKQSSRTTSGKKGPKEDYIDFEEIPVSKR